ncbi:hypothetical protein KIW84_060385 [Lathyrus oleraceus]|uniref:Syntaxin 6/10/61 N-terminal domain-containing protein n=1 Tax=Pisum sativum TaxID=3888 RepID=A0A9D4W277_PEA|nr:hypothetical protein KIW84_060385 [Pisum sativum]KAI5393244.1 hypothetical protein KIW84_060385 [Pisum sativum]
MATSFDRWEKDPFFNAAEEVQESADRMESTFRTWVHATKDTSSIWNPNELRRDLLTTLGTAKWQVNFDHAKCFSTDTYEKRRSIFSFLFIILRKCFVVKCS